MVIRGRVEHGVVVLEEQVSLPEGTEVTVMVRAAAESGQAAERGATPRDQQGRVSDEEHQGIVAELERIAALPIEGRRDPFSGANHDKVLYGEP